MKKVFILIGVILCVPFVISISYTLWQDYLKPIPSNPSSPYGFRNREYIVDATKLRIKHTGNNVQYLFPDSLGMIKYLEKDTVYDPMHKYFMQTVNANFYCKEQRFIDNVLFRDVHFENAYFNNCVFGDSSLPNAFVGFEECRFDSNFLFTGVFNQDFTFREVGFSGNSIIECKQSNLNRSIRLTYRNCSFGKNVSFVGHSFPLKKEWRELKAPKLELSSVYVDGVLNLEKYPLENGQPFKFDFVTVDTINLSHLPGSPLIDISTAYNIRANSVSRWWHVYLFWYFLFRPYASPEYTPKIKVNLTGTDVTNIKMDFKYFELYFNNATQDEMHGMYRSLIDKFKKEGKTESEEYATIAYQDFQGGIINFFSKCWWNYGYSKGRVFMWAFLFLSLYTGINYFYLNELKLKIYNLEFIPFVERKQKLLLLWFAFLYTAILFFSLRLHIERMHFQRKGAVVYLMSIYIVGIICLAYMANFVLSN